MAVILFLGVASASPQLGVGIGGGGHRFGGGAGGFGRPNVITNTRQGVCGQFAAACYGQGLETVGAFPVNPFIAQCMAQTISQIPQATGKYLLRVDFTGELVVTNHFGQEIGDIEPQPTGFGLAAQQQALSQQFALESIQQRLEFCGGSR